MQSDWYSVLASAVSVEFELYVEHRNWMAAQWMALPEETQEKYMEEMKEEKEDGDEYDAMFAQFF
jgi:hypothetical protein